MVEKIFDLGFRGKSFFDGSVCFKDFKEDLAFRIGREMYISGRSYDPMGIFSSSLSESERLERERNIRARNYSIQNV